MNFVTCTGLIAEEAGERHKVWEHALQTNTVLNVPLRELIKYDAIYPSKGKNVFILENSSVYSEVLDHCGGEVYPALVCTHGQFKLSAFVLMDKLVEQGNTLYYSGDFDPEGLQMAQRLKERYPKHVKLWLYDEQYYELAMSEVTLSDERLRKLESVSLPELQMVKEAMKASRKAGYQEELVEVIGNRCTVEGD
ncbi:DUF2399 domain-containing protein [Bacillus tianshenii]|nr:DUF2399 domain-containing protein [Bacillus tianshenii]